MLDRIKKLMDQKKLTPTQFSEIIEVQRSSLSHVLSGRNKPSLDFMLKIKNGFPEINLDWLLLGQGEMEIKAAKSFGDEDNERTRDTSQAEIAFVEKNNVPEKTPSSKLDEVITRQKDIKQDYKIDKEPVRVILFYKDRSFESFDLKTK